jgi:hypothetical protein
VTYDGVRLPFGDAAFDTALVLLVLYHCAKPETALDEALRVTRCRLSVEDWQNLFDLRKLRAVETRWLGSWLERLVHHPLLFVLEV